MAYFFPVDLIQQGKSIGNNKRTVSMVSDLTQVERACSNLQEKLTLVLEYVEEVLVGSGYLTLFWKLVNTCIIVHSIQVCWILKLNLFSHLLLKANKIQPDTSIGRYLLDLVNNVPKIEPEEFETMLNSNMKVCRLNKLLIKTVTMIIKSAYQTYCEINFQSTSIKPVLDICDILIKPVYCINFDF